MLWNVEGVVALEVEGLRRRWMRMAQKQVVEVVMVQLGCDSTKQDIAEKMRFEPLLRIFDKHCTDVSRDRQR